MEARTESVYPNAVELSDFSSPERSSSSDELNYILAHGVPFWKKPTFCRFAFIIFILLIAAVITLTVLLVIHSRPCHVAVSVTTSSPSTTLSTLSPITTAAAPKPVPMCSDGYTYSTLTGFCYRASPVPVTIENAMGICEKENGHLTSIHSKAENDLVSHLYFVALVDYQNTIDISLTTASIWIGLTYNPTLKNFEWDDGSKYDFTYWVPGEPAGMKDGWNKVWMENERLNYDDGKHWYNVKAGEQRVAYVCKKPAL